MGTSAGELLRFRDVVVSPYTDLVAMAFGGLYHRGGPDWPDWDNQVEARHRAGGHVVDDRPVAVADAAPLSGTYAWAGAVVPHFGHQIADFSMRILPTLVASPDAVLLFATDPDLAITSLSETSVYFREILAWFGVPELRFRLVTEPVRLPELLVAPQAEQIAPDTVAGTGPSAAHLDSLDELTQRRFGAIERSGTLYVSRAAQHARMAGEAYLEDRFREAGVQVMRPETLSLEAQLRAYAGADRLIFAYGSAVHATQLLGRALGHVTVIPRRNDLKLSQTPMEPRAESFAYVEASLGVVHGADEVGRPAPYGGVSVLDEDQLLHRLSGIGVDLRPGWSSAAYGAARDADVVDWVRREMETARGGMPEERAFITDTLTSTGLARLLPVLPKAVDEPRWSPAGGTRPVRSRWRSAIASLAVTAATSRRVPGQVHRNAVIRSFFGNPLFDADWYRDRYPDVRLQGAHPYRHFLRHGAREGRLPNPFFETAWYAERNPGAAARWADPTDHYRTVGAKRGRDPGPRFSTHGYLRSNADVRAANLNPLEHYLRRGLAEGRGRSGRTSTQGTRGTTAMPSDMPWSARRINALAAALGATSYVEIGVAGGHTFHAIDVAERTGVDPHFRFATRDFADAHTFYEQKPSDDFFASLEPGRTFDLYFIDGLHTFEQAYRDLLNSLAHAHARTAFLIDDTVPSDRFSAIPDHDEAIRQRRAAGGSSSSWHGDVFKLVFAIDDLQPDLDYRTIKGSGNPQTLAWRAPSAARVARFGSLEAIQALTYEDLQENLDVLRFALENDAIEACLKALRDR